MSDHSELRREIVQIVSLFCLHHQLDFRETWRKIYQVYEDKYHIPVATWYKMGKTKDKMTFLESYEPLYQTLTKMYNLVKELKL